MQSQIISFPAPVVRLHIAPRAELSEDRTLFVVEHDGRLYSFATLLAGLPDAVLDELDALVPRSAQETWDLVVRRWPKLAKAVIGI